MTFNFASYWQEKKEEIISAGLKILVLLIGILALGWAHAVSAGAPENMGFIAKLVLLPFAALQAAGVSALWATRITFVVATAIMMVGGAISKVVYAILAVATMVFMGIFLGAFAGGVICMILMIICLGIAFILDISNGGKEKKS